MQNVLEGERSVYCALWVKGSWAETSPKLNYVLRLVFQGL